MTIDSNEASASVAKAFAVLRDLQNTRRLYPNAFTETENRCFWDKGHLIIEQSSYGPGSEWFIPLNEKDELPVFDDLDEAVELAFEFASKIAVGIFIQSTPELSDIDLGDRAGCIELETVWNKAQKRQIKKLAEDLARLCCDKCILATPSANTGNLDARRISFLLVDHERLIHDLASEAAKAKISSFPMSVTRLLIMLQKRVRACWSAFPELASDESRALTEWFLDVMLDGRICEFVVGEGIESRFQKLDRYIEEREQQYSTISLNRNFAEQCFFDFAVSEFGKLQIELSQANSLEDESSKRIEPVNNSPPPIQTPSGSKDASSSTVKIPAFSAVETIESEFIDEGNPPAELLHELTIQQGKIVTFLWNSKHATKWQSLPDDCWRTGSTSDQNDRTIESALERLRGKMNLLSQFGLILEVHSAKSTTKLIHNLPRK